MSTAHKFQWSTMFSGLREITWADLPSEISAGITRLIWLISMVLGAVCAVVKP
jgi:hypothetical protein